MKGRKPKPTALKLLAGNPGRRPLPKHEPQPKRVMPSAPEHLSRQAAIAWGSMGVRLDRLGVLTENEPEALEELCECYAEILTLRSDIAEHGRFQTITTTAGDKVDKPRAQYTALCDASRRFQSLMNDFGLTPSSRTRVSTVLDADNADPAAAYFG